LNLIIDDLNVFDKIALAFGYSSGFKRTCYENKIVTAKDWTWYVLCSEIFLVYIWYYKRCFEAFSK